MNTPYENLANAIVLCAVQDYRKALLFLKRHPHTPDLDTDEAVHDKRTGVLRSMIVRKEDERDKIERFFRSEWFEALSNLDGEVLLKKIRSMRGDLI